jgi:DinB superfamily
MNPTPNDRSTGTPPRKTLDDYRRERGEGWQWARAQAERCPQCGEDASSIDHAQLADALVEAASAWRTFLTGADEEYLRAIPGPGIFSPMQYGAHVRDIQRVYGDRILLMVREESPVFPQFNPDETAWAGYNQLEIEQLAEDLEAQARRLADILDGLQPAEWSRTMIRDGGSDGVYEFTVAGLASYAVHEARHHLLDANGTLAPQSD